MIRDSLRLTATAFLAAVFVWGMPGPVVAQPTMPVGPGSSPGASPAGVADSPATGPLAPTPSNAAAPTPPRAKESPLETVYLFDEEGNLLPVIKAYTWEELEEFLRQKAMDDGAQESPRAFSLQEVDVDVRVDPERASATAKFKIKLHRSGWTRVPLRFDAMALEGEPQSPTGKSLDLEYDRAEGWVVYLEGEPDETVELTLPFISTATGAYDDQTWRATLPAATSSTARLSIAGGRWQVEEAPRAIVRETSFDGQRTSIALRLVGDAAISWSKPAESESAVATFEAVETARVSVDSPTEAACESSFLVQPLDGPLKTVYVALPQGAIFVPSPGSPSPGSATVAIATPEERQRILPAGVAGTLLRIDASMASTASFRFSVAYRAVSSTSDRIVLERPRLVRAVRQSGTVEVMASEKWNLGWTPRGSLERIDRSADDQDQPGSAAMFAYSQAPAPLEIAVEPRTSQLIVDPVILFDVDRRQTVLDLRLTCRFHGVGELKVQLPGWTVTDVGPSELIDGERLNLTQVDPLSVPFAAGANVEAGDAEIRIRAIRHRKEGDKRLELSMPRIEEAVVNPALIAVQSADEVQVLEVRDETQGLTPDVWTSDVALQERQQAPLVYRNYGDVSDARVVLTAESKSRQVAVDERAELIASEEGVALEQRFAVQSTYGKLDRLDLWIPVERLLEGTTPVVTVNGVATTPALIDAVNPTLEAPLETPDGMKRFRIAIDPPRAGLTTIGLLWDREAPVGDGSSKESLRLARAVLPPEARRSVQPAVARSIAPARLEMDSERWQATGDSASDREGGDRYIAADAANLVAIDFRRSLRQIASDTEPRAERAWLHTEATASGLRQRFVLRVRNPGGSLRVRLPESALQASAVVAWNGVHQPSSTDGDLLVDLTASDSTEFGTDGSEAVADSGTLEIWYAETRDSAWDGLTTHLPETELDVDGVLFHWSVRLPPEETVLAAPSGMRSETNWKWTGWRFVAEPALTMRDLEQWSGATRQPPASSRSGISVYSAFQPPEKIHLASVPRTWAYLLYGLAAFALASAWIYVPRVRRAWVAVAAAVGIGVLTLLAPELALPAAQVAAFGLAFAVVAAAVDWWINGRAASTASVRSVATSRRGHSEPGTRLEEKRDVSTQSLQTPQAEITA
jgi:hypothetical protein